MSKNNDTPTWKFLIRKSTLANIIAGGLVIFGVAYFMITGDSETVKTLTLIGAGVLFKTVVDNSNKTK